MDDVRVVEVLTRVRNMGWEGREITDALDHAIATIERERWRPIELAPRGGREMILLLTPSRFPQVAFSNTWWTAGFSVECKPTHWMPLPPLPDPQPDGQEG